MILLLYCVNILSRTIKGANMNYNTKRLLPKIIAGIFVILFTIIFCFAGLVMLYGGTITFFIPFQQWKADKYTEAIDNTPQDEILFLGDSITEMYNLEYFYPDKEYINRGIASNETKDILARLQTNVIAVRPSTVFFLAGVNDIGHGVGQQVTLDNIKQILTTLQTELPDTRIFVQSVYPTRTLDNMNSHKLTKPRPNESIVSLNKGIMTICQDMSITYIDVHKELLDEQNMLNANYTMDGLHINKFGYEVISNTLKKYI